MAAYPTAPGSGWGGKRGPQDALDRECDSRQATSPLGGPVCEVCWSVPSKGTASAVATAALSCDTKDRVPELEL